MLALGPRASWPSGASWLPAVMTGTEDRTRGAAAKLGGFDYGHAVFEPFRARAAATSRPRGCMATACSRPHPAA